MAGILLIVVLHIRLEYQGKYLLLLCDGQCILVKKGGGWGLLGVDVGG